MTYLKLPRIVLYLLIFAGVTAKYNRVAGAAVATYPTWCLEPEKLFTFMDRKKSSCNGKLRKLLLDEFKHNMDKACDHDFQDLEHETTTDSFTMEKCKKIHKMYEPTENLEETTKAGIIQYTFLNDTPSQDVRNYWAKNCDEVRNKHRLLKRYYGDDDKMARLKKNEHSQFRAKRKDWETVVGFWQDLAKTKGGKGDLLTREKHKLFTRKWTPCFNMRWIICGAAGKLPRQAESTFPGLVKVVTTDKQLENMVKNGEERVTLSEVCLLKLVCPILNNKTALHKQIIEKHIPQLKKRGAYRFQCDFDKDMLEKLEEEDPLLASS